MKQFEKTKIEDFKCEIHKNLFEVEFDFNELSEKEKNILTDLVTKVTGEYLEFNLQSVNNIVQPLDILIRLKNNKVTGDVTIKMHNKESEVLAEFKFKKFKVTEINDLIDFDFSEETINKTSTKTLTIRFNYDDILYSNDSKEYEKLT
jgi:hypothetical protein